MSRIKSFYVGFYSCLVLGRNFLIMIRNMLWISELSSLTENTRISRLFNCRILLWRFKVIYWGFCMLHAEGQALVIKVREMRKWWLSWRSQVDSVWETAERTIIWDRITVRNFFLHRKVTFHLLNITIRLKVPLEILFIFTVFDKVRLSTHNLRVHYLNLAHRFFLLISILLRHDCPMLIKVFQGELVSELHWDGGLPGLFYKDWANFLGRGMEVCSVWQGKVLAFVHFFRLIELSGSRASDLFDEAFAKLVCFFSLCF